MRKWLSCWALLLALAACGEAPPTPESGQTTTPLSSARSEVVPLATGLSLLVLGSGGPDGADEDRASSAYLIFVDGVARVLFDAGGGSYARLVEAQVDVRDLEYIFLSHLHIDHMADLSAIIKLVLFQHRAAGSTREAPFLFFGPAANGVTFPQTEIAQYPGAVAFIDGRYAMEAGSERYLHLFARAIDAGAFSYAVEEVDADPAVEAQTLAPMDGVVVTAVGVHHGPAPALAYRLEYGGRSLVYTGDTSSRSDNLIDLGADTDLLIYDTAITDDQPGGVISTLHTTPSRLAEVAVRAGARALLLSHLTGTSLKALGEIKGVIADSGYGGRVAVAEDLEIYHLPPEP